MTFLRTIPPEEATGKLRELYDEDLKMHGRATNFAQMLSLRPEAGVALLAFMKALTSSLESTMKPRHHGLANIVAASRVGCSA
jgi:hypothetical protein